MDIQLFSLPQTRDQITEAYAPVTIARIDDFALRLVKFQGEFERWHAHDHEDECFVVLEGEVLFQTESGDVLVKAGEGLVIPKGLRHCPTANAEGPLPVALIIERAETKRLGDGE